jgi:hypothetical protein
MLKVNMFGQLSLKKMIDFEHESVLRGVSFYGSLEILRMLTGALIDPRD